MCLACMQLGPPSILPPEPRFVLRAPMPWPAASVCARTQMTKTQKNKATAKHLGLLKAKLAKLKAELVSGGVRWARKAMREAIRGPECGDMQTR